MKLSDTKRLFLANIDKATIPALQVRGVKPVTIKTAVRDGLIRHIGHKFVLTEAGRAALDSEGASHG